MALVLGVGDGLEELGISPGAADVFGRAASDSLDQARIGDTGSGSKQTLDLDRVLPAIAKILEVLERFGADIFKHVVETGLARVERTISTPVGMWLTPSHLPNADFVEVTVGPAHRSLDCEVQPIERYIERHLDATQDYWLDVVEGDLELGNGVGTHAATLGRSISAAQFHGKSSSSLWMA